MDEKKTVFDELDITRDESIPSNDISKKDKDDNTAKVNNRGLVWKRIWYNVKSNYAFTF